MIQERRKREFYLNEPLKHLVCPACNDVFLQCTKTPCCSNYFCRDCIKTTCPFCNTKIDQKKLEPVTQRDEEIGQLQIECETRCGWRGKLNQEEEHLKDCDVFNQLVHDVCGWKGKDLQYHVKHECPEILVTCEKADFGCKWKDTRSKLKEHKEVCLYYSELAQITFNYITKLQTKITSLEQQVQRLTELSHFGSGTCVKSINNISEAFPNALLEFGETIIVGDTKGKIHLIQEYENRKEVDLDGHKDAVNELVQLSSNTFASCSDDRSIIIWKIEGNKFKIEKLLQESAIKTLVVKDQHMISVSKDQVTIYSKEGEIQNQFLHSQGNSWSSVLLRDGNLLIGGGHNSCSTIYNLKGEKKTEIEETSHDVIHEIFELKNGRIISLNHKNHGVIHNLHSKKQFCLEIEKTNCGIELYDGRIAINSDTRVLIMDVKEKEPRIIHILSGHENLVKKMIQLKDGRLLTCSEDYSLKFWKL